MPIDIQIGRVCDHRIVDETLALDGMSPYYYADLRFPTNLNVQQMEVREFFATEANQNYVYNLDGITDFKMIGDQRMEFNQLLFAPGVNFIEGSTFVVPGRIYLATYITPLAECPKCLSEKEIRDVGFSQVGQLQLVTSTDRVRQNVSKALLTVIGNNVFNPDYGSTLSFAIGEKLTPTIFFKIQQSIINAIQGLIEIQAQEVDTLPADEILLGLDNLEIEIDPVDPRTINIVITVLVGTFDKVTTNLQIKVQ